MPGCNQDIAGAVENRQYPAAIFMCTGVQLDYTSGQLLSAYGKTGMSLHGSHVHPRPVVAKRSPVSRSTSSTQRRGSKCSTNTQFRLRSQDLLNNIAETCKRQNDCSGVSIASHLFLRRHSEPVSSARTTIDISHQLSSKSSPRVWRLKHLF